RTGGYGYDRRIIAGLRGLGWTAHVVRLDDGFPAPPPAAREPAAQALAAVPGGPPGLLDRPALGALPEGNARGAGPLRIVARVRAQVRDSGLEDRVVLAGDLDTGALAAEYARADLFVLATLYEGYGMAVAEALARGLPVVSTATGAIDDLVTGVGVRSDFP